jgi:uncharacterized protein YfeS
MDLNRFFFGRPLSQDEITKKEMKAQKEAQIKAAQIIEADRIKREALYGKIKTEGGSKSKTKRRRHQKNKKIYSFKKNTNKKRRKS